MFCIACKTLFETPIPTRDGVKVEHLSYNEISKSRHTCVMCAQLWRGEGPERALLQENVSTTNAPSTDSSDRRCMTIYLFFNGSTRTIRRGAESLRCYRMGSSEVAAYKTQQLSFISSAPDIRPSGLDSWKACLPRIKALLRQCDNEHKMCDTMSKSEYWLRRHIAHFQPGAKPWLPKRLVRFSPKSSTIRLCDSRKLPRSTRYMTLSHRWCNEPGAQLTAESYQAFYRGIDASEIRDTFANAMQVCLDLGIEYIWIDSMCIIQGTDGLDDWREQAKTMHLVYANSYLNLCADATENGASGLFPSWSVATVGELWYQDSRNQVWIPSINQCNFERSMELSPLSSRGWVVQEMFFSPRTLHFTYLQLSLRCRNGTWSSGNPDEGGSELQTGIHGLRSGLDGADPRQLLKDWYKLAHIYSSANLTVPSDRPVAYGGIAEAFTRVFDRLPAENGYVAGLWRQSIHQDLLWYCIQGFEGSPNKYTSQNSEESASPPTSEAVIAPSWSWLSVNTSIDWLHIRRPYPLYFLSHRAEPCAEIDGIKHLSLEHTLHGRITLKAESFNIELISGHTFLVDCDRRKNVIVYFWDGEMMVPPDGVYICAALVRDTANPLVRQGIIMKSAPSAQGLSSLAAPSEAQQAYHVRCGVWFTASADAHCARENREASGSLTGFINRDVLTDLYANKVTEGTFHLI